MISDADAQLLQPYVLMLRTRLRLASIDQQTDPNLKIPDSALMDAIQGAVFTHNPLYTLQTMPSNEVQFVMWLAMIEVYYMIATEAAQYYQIGAQGAELNRQQLFDHYTLLAKQLQDKYDTAWDKFMIQTWEAESVDVVIPTRYNPRNYRLIKPPTTTLSVVAQTPTSIDLQWTAVTDRQIMGYRIYQHFAEIIDEFNMLNTDLINPQAISYYYSPDVWRTKARVANLTPGQVYFLAVYIEDVYGRKCWSEISIQQPLIGNTVQPILSTNQSTLTSVN